MWLAGPAVVLTYVVLTDGDLLALCVAAVVPVLCRGQRCVGSSVQRGSLSASFTRATPRVSSEVVVACHLSWGCSRRRSPARLRLSERYVLSGVPLGWYAFRQGFFGRGERLSRAGDHSHARRRCQRFRSRLRNVQRSVA